MSASADPQTFVRSLDVSPDSSDTFEITIRFSASLPDLPLSIPVTTTNNGAPTTATLKQLIRASLPTEFRSKRVRLIHAGKALDDSTLLSASLKRHASRPPSRIATPSLNESSTNTDAEHDGPYGSSITSKARGKLAVRDPPLVRTYIHCSIGDVTLSAEDLEAEALLAISSTNSPDAILNPLGAAPVSPDATKTTTPQPRGFDRLASAGFSHSEIATLRLQFMSIQSHTHTPESMPSPNTLRALEDQWLDNSNSSTSLLNLDESTGAVATGLEDDTSRGALDDMIWGTAAGFFWPVACVLWGLREDGIFTPRRKIAVVVGGMLNLGLGFVRWGG